MTTTEIRDAFGHNAVYGHDDTPAETNRLLRIQILVMGELAAQFAEFKEFMER